jgi:hypothetical protein
MPYFTPFAKTPTIVDCQNVLDLAHLHSPSMTFF